MLAVGNVLPIALEASDRLRERGHSVRVESFHSIKPLDESCLSEAFDQCRLVVSLEEHSIIGGAGAAIAEWLCDRSVSHTRLLRIATADTFLHKAGSQAYARSEFGLDVESIVAKVSKAWADVNGD